MIFPGVQELDDKYVTVTKVESRQEYERQTQDYQTTNFGGRTENGKNYFPNEDKDFMEVRNEKSNKFSVFSNFHDFRRYWSSGQMAERQTRAP